jgi:tRNA/rRNA methyltransferase
MKLDRLGVAMVQPRYGLNVGYVARVMKNFGLRQLYVIGTRELPKTASKFASHGSDIIDSARFVTFEELLQMFDVVIGTTAITAGRGRNALRKTITLGGLALTGIDPTRTVVVLGRDTTGLKNEELEFCDLVLHVSTGTAYSTLNISHALAIILYELSGFRRRTSRPMERKYLDMILRNLQRMTELSGCPIHRQDRVIRVFRKALVESCLDDNDATTILGALRKTNLALEGRF